MNRQSQKYKKWVGIGLMIMGWLLVGFAIYVNLNEARDLSTDKILGTVLVLSIAIASWFGWIWPKLRVGRFGMVAISWSIIVAAAFVIELTSPSFLVKLASDVAASMGIVVGGDVIYIRATK